MQNVTVNGTAYTGVDTIKLSKVGGGTADYKDTSDANAVATDIASGKTAYVNGAKVTGTHTDTAPTLATKNITANGTYNASADSADGYSSVVVNVPQEGGSDLTTKSVTENGTYNAADDSADGYSSVTVNVPTGITPTGSLSITENGTVDVTDYASAVVNVPTSSGALDQLLKAMIERPVTETAVTIPNGVDSVGVYAFYGFGWMTSVVIPETVTAIRANAFQSCSRLTSVTIPSSCITVAAQAFKGCTQLTSVSFGGQCYVTMNNAFEGCNAVMLYDFSAFSSVPVLSSTVGFGHAANCVIKIPASLASEWKAAAGWSSLTDVVWQDENGNVV